MYKELGQECLDCECDRLIVAGDKMIDPHENIGWTKTKLIKIALLKMVNSSTGWRLFKLLVEQNASLKICCCLIFLKLAATNKPSSIIRRKHCKSSDFADKEETHQIKQMVVKLVWVKKTELRMLTLKVTREPWWWRSRWWERRASWHQGQAQSC